MSSPWVPERKHHRALQQLLRACILDTPFDFVPDNLEEFLSECIQEGLAGGLARQIDRHGHASQVLRQRSTEVFKNQFFQYARYQVLLTKIHQGLLKVGAQILLLKGAALNRASYPAGVRHVSDVDLFALGPNKQHLVDLLLNMQFRQGKSSSMFATKDGLIVDLHGPELGRVETAVGLDGQELWRRSIPDPQYPSFRILSPADELNYLALHSLKHSYARYIWFWDLWICLQRPTSRENPSRSPALDYASECAAFLLQQILQPTQVKNFTNLRQLDRHLLHGMLNDYRHPLGQVLLGCNLPGLTRRLTYFWTILSEGGSLNPFQFTQKLIMLGRLSLSHLRQIWATRNPRDNRATSA